MDRLIELHNHVFEFYTGDHLTTRSVTSKSFLWDSGSEHEHVDEERNESLPVTVCRATHEYLESGRAEKPNDSELMASLLKIYQSPDRETIKQEVCLI